MRLLTKLKLRSDAMIAIAGIIITFSPPIMIVLCALLRIRCIGVMVGVPMAIGIIILYTGFILDYIDHYRQRRSQENRLSQQTQQKNWMKEYLKG